MSQHCIDQVLRFTDMLDSITSADRSHNVLLAQLGYNLGRYAELNAVDGRALWRLFEKCVTENMYRELHDHFAPKIN